jgi:hypothetical protein
MISHYRLWYSAYVVPIIAMEQSESQHSKGIALGSEELRCDIDSWGVIASRLEGIMTNKDCDIRLMIKKDFRIG